MDMMTRLVVSLQDFKSEGWGFLYLLLLLSLLPVMYI
jgi:hypothetical protein